MCIEEIRRAGLYDPIWQAFTVLLPVKTVGVMGDGYARDFDTRFGAVRLRSLQFAPVWRIDILVEAGAEPEMALFAGRFSRALGPRLRVGGGYNG